MNTKCDQIINHDNTAHIFFHDNIISINIFYFKYIHNGYNNSVKLFYLGVLYDNIAGYHNKQVANSHIGIWKHW